MDVDDPLVEAAESVQALITPSAVGVETTFAALGRTVESVHADCRTISGTLEALGDALSLVSQGAGVGQEWGGFGLVSLPIVGAIRAVKAAASQYVNQQTGVPLRTWTELVTSATSQFDGYVAQLDVVAELCLRYRDPARGPVDTERGRKDVDTLVHALWQTQAWKQILGRVAQLGKVVEAILQIELRDAVPEDAAVIAALWHAGWADAHEGRVPSALLEHRSHDSFRDRVDCGVSIFRLCHVSPPE